MQRIIGQEYDSPLFHKILYYAEYKVKHVYSIVLRENDSSSPFKGLFIRNHMRLSYASQKPKVVVPFKLGLQVKR
jgi:hypothetical protein